MKLGRLAAQFDPAVPQMHQMFLKAPAPTTPTEFRFKTVQYWPMLLNDQIGDCTVAGIGHIGEYWKFIGVSSPYVMTDAEALDHYKAITGFDGNMTINPNPTDTGAVELNVLQYFSQIRMVASQPFQLSKFINIQTLDIEEICYSIQNLGNCYFGVNLPSNALSVQTWDVVPGTKVVGGHCINGVGFDKPNQLIYIVSWGQVIPVTFRFMQAYLEEAWTLYSPDWLIQTGIQLHNFDHQTILNS